MLVPISFFVAIALAIFSYSQGQGGPVAGLVFFGVLFVGVLAYLGGPGRSTAEDGAPAPTEE